MRKATLLFLVQKSEPEGEIKNICLAMKKRGFGAGRWNGVGGKVEKNEEIESAAKRETKEEIGVSVEKCQKKAELAFYFPLNPEWNQIVHVYFAEKWEGQPTESEEMKPQWFLIPEIPFKSMWPDDAFWLPEVLKGKFVRGKFKFGKEDSISIKHLELH